MVNSILAQIKSAVRLGVQADAPTEAESHPHIIIQNLSAETPKLALIASIDMLWAIESNAAAQIIETIGGLTVADFIRLERESKLEGSSEPSQKYEVKGGTAIIPINGTMTKRPTSASWLLGGASTMQVRDLLKVAASDPLVQRVMLLIESPGGQVSGTAELFDAIKAFPKPIQTYFEDTGASAAYWVGIGANKVFANESAVIGSIGVKMALQDSSVRAAMMGVKVIPVTTGKMKAAGAPGTPITDEQIAYFTDLVNASFAQFKSSVMSQRGMDDSAFAHMADGRVVLAPEALERGLIDAICPFDQCLAEFASAGTFSTSVGSPLARQSQQEKEPMQLKEILAKLKGIPQETLAEHGVNLEDIQGEPDVTNSQLTSEMARIKAGVLHAAAEQHWATLITIDENGAARATWAEKDGIIATFKALALLDGKGEVTLDANGAFQAGESLKAFTTANMSRAKNYLQAQRIPDSDPERRPAIRLDAIEQTLASKFGKKKAAEMMGSYKEVLN